MKVPDCQLQMGIRPRLVVSNQNTVGRTHATGDTHDSFVKSATYGPCRSAGRCSVVKQEHVSFWGICSVLTQISMISVDVEFTDVIIAVRIAAASASGDWPTINGSSNNQTRPRTWNFLIFLLRIILKTHRMDQHMGPYMSICQYGGKWTSMCQLFSSVFIFRLDIFFPWHGVRPSDTWSTTIHPRMVVHSEEDVNSEFIAMEEEEMGEFWRRGHPIGVPFSGGWKSPLTGDFRGGDTRVLTHRSWEGIFFGPSIAFCF